MAKRKTTRRGVPNRQYAAAIELPAACPTCGSTNLLVVKGSQTIVRDIAGSINSTTYDRVKWTKRQCQDCQQFVAVRTYLAKSSNEVSTSGD